MKLNEKLPLFPAEWNQENLNVTAAALVQNQAPAFKDLCRSRSWLWQPPAAQT